MPLGPNQSRSGSQAEIDQPDQVLARRPVPAWLMSSLLHTALLLLLGLTFRVTIERPGADVEPGRSGGIVLVKRSDGKPEYFDGGEEGTALRASRETTAASNAASPLPSSADLTFNLDGVLPSTGSVIGSRDVVGMLPDAGDLTVGAGPSKQIGGAAQTEVFGVQGTGNEFVYVFDRSMSMSGYGGRPLRAAKRELIASLQDLGKMHQFQIIFYNQAPQIFHPIDGPPRMFWGDEPSKMMADRFVKSIVADGNTRHMNALSMALKMHPDVIFFLTDANDPQLNEDELRSVRRLNTGGATVINAIQFGYGPYDGEENFLKRIARENGGQWAYQDISKLPD